MRDNKQSKELQVPLGNLIGISMIAAGLILVAVVVWQSLAYRKRQRNLDDHLDA
jgi:uncharacterized integral membrane protein